MDGAGDLRRSVRAKSKHHKVRNDTSTIASTGLGVRRSRRETGGKKRDLSAGTKRALNQPLRRIQKAKRSGDLTKTKGDAREKQGDSTS